MHLQSGTRLGAYEIVSPLGAGGMGEVYRARDTRLDRTVALKVLPARFGGKSDLRERFEREARVVSNLNHPNICALYDVGQQDGVAYFVMEYIEGQSLADRIGKGPLPLDQALRIAAAIGDALAKAHRHGIVHRDLKPGNVMLTKSGAKLLDFGLARTASSRPVVMPDEATVAGSTPLTAEGTILGTLQYMSPEQLEGGEIDARSDVFAFGAVLYEMVTGQRAFAASSHASVITRIMSEEPRPVRELQPVTPVALEHLIARCLAKDPDKRWQCAADLVAELRTIGSGTREAASSPKRSMILPWIAAAVLLATSALLAYRLVRKPALPAELVRFELAPPTADSSFFFDALSNPLAVSSNGRRIVFINSQSGQKTLWMRSLDAAAPVRLEGTSQAVGPFWSPDGKTVGFFAGGKLQAIDVATGAVRPICETSPGATYSATWSPDGTIVYAELARDGGLFAVPASGGTPKKLPAGQGLYGYHFPQFLSDGKHFLFAGLDVASPALYSGSTDGSAPRRIQSETARVAWVRPYIVYFRDGSLFAQHFDEEKLAFDGPAQPLAIDAQAYWPTGSSAHAASAQTLVALPWPAQRTLRWIDRTGKVVASGPAADYYQMRLSPDGTKLAATLTDRKTGVGSLATLDVARKTLTRASFDKIDHDTPVWSPDSRQIAFASDVEGPPHLFIHDLGSGKSEMLLPVSELQFPGSWTDDGRIFYQEVRLETRGDLMTISPSTRKPEVWLSTPFNESDPAVSPNGHWVVFSSDESGTRELYAARIDRPREAVRLTTGGANRVRWSRDNREIYFLRGRDVFALPMNVEGDSIAAAEPQHLFTATSDIQDYDVDASGRFLVAQHERSASGVPLTVVVNWQTTLAK